MIPLVNLFVYIQWSCSSPDHKMADFSDFRWFISTSDTFRTSSLSPCWVVIWSLPLHYWYSICRSERWMERHSLIFYHSIKTKCKLPFTSFKKAQSWKVSLSLLRNSLTIRPNQEIDLSGTKNAFNLIRRLNLSKRECKIRYMHMNIDISCIKAKHLVHIFYSYINLDKTGTP